MTNSTGRTIVQLTVAFLFLCAGSLLLPAQRENEPAKKKWTVRKVIDEIRSARAGTTRFLADLNVRFLEGDRTREVHAPRISGSVSWQAGSGFETMLNMLVPDDDVYGAVFHHVAGPEKRFFNLNWFGENMMWSGAFSRSHEKKRSEAQPFFITGLLTEGNSISFLPLLEYNLFPASLKSFSADQIKTGVQWNGNDYVTLTKTSQWARFQAGRIIPVTYRLYFDPAAARFVRADLTTPFLQFEMTAGSLREVDGLTVPDTLDVKVFEQQQRKDLEGLMEIHLPRARVRTTAVENFLPDWTSDPADLDPDAARERMSSIQGAYEYHEPNLLMDRSPSFLINLQKRSSNRYVGYVVARSRSPREGVSFQPSRSAIERFFVKTS